MLDRSHNRVAGGGYCTRMRVRTWCWVCRVRTTLTTGSTAQPPLTKEPPSGTQCLELPLEAGGKMVPYAEFVLTEAQLGDDRTVFPIVDQGGVAANVVILTLNE